MAREKNEECRKFTWACTLKRHSEENYRCSISAMSRRTRRLGKKTTWQWLRNLLTIVICFPFSWPSKSILAASSSAKYSKSLHLFNVRVCERASAHWYHHNACKHSHTKQKELDDAITFAIEFRTRTIARNKTSYVIKGVCEKKTYKNEGEQNWMGENERKAKSE